MNNLPITGELFATNQVSANTERCYKCQLITTTGPNEESAIETILSVHSVGVQIFA